MVPCLLTLSLPFVATSFRSVLFWWFRQEVVHLTLPRLTLGGVRKGGRVERRRGKGGRLAVPRVTGMYSKHRQKNAQISPAKCGRLFVFLSFLLLSGTLERADGNTGEQGKEPSGHACKTSSSIYQLRVETPKLSGYAFTKGSKCVLVVSRF